MKKTATILLALVVLASTACSSPSLSEEESTWCRQASTARLVEEGEAIGIDLAPVFDRGQEIFDSLSEEGTFTEANAAAIEDTEADPDFIEVCKAAYAGR